MKTPEISIITPTYNCELYFFRTADSVFSQTNENWEWIITDDASSDSTWKILEKLAQKDDRIKIARNPINLGAAESRNNSIRKARGEYLAFLDSDDTWKSTKLERHLIYMKKHKIHFSFTAYQVAYCNKLKNGRLVDHKANLKVTYNDMLNKKATMGCSTIIIARKTIDNNLMPNIRTGQDYAFWLSILRKGNIAYCFPEALTQYNIRSNSISRNKVKKALRQWEIYRKLEKIGILKSCWHFSNYAFRAMANQ